MLKFAAAFYALFVCSATACDIFTGEGSEFVPGATLTWHPDGIFTLADSDGSKDYVFQSTGMTDVPYSMGVSTKDKNDVVLIRELDGKWIIDMVVFTCAH
jgi:hypothetical protein